MPRIEKIWKDKALIVVSPVLAPSQQHGEYLHLSDKQLILIVAKALRSAFEEGKSFKQKILGD